MGRKEIPKVGMIGKSVKACHFPPKQNGWCAHASDECQAAGFALADVRKVQRIKRYL